MLIIIKIINHYLNRISLHALSLFPFLLFLFSLWLILKILKERFTKNRFILVFFVILFFFKIFMIFKLSVQNLQRKIRHRYWIIIESIYSLVITYIIFLFYYLAINRNISWNVYHMAVLDISNIIDFILFSDYTISIILAIYRQILISSAMLGTSPSFFI